MRQISALLNIHDFSYENHCSQLAGYKRDVDADFWSKTWSGDRDRLQELGQIKTNEDYKTWCESKSSGMFVISGENDSYRAHHCWASSAALDFLDEKLANGSTDRSSICAFHIFGNKDHENTYSNVLSSLVYQILRADREILQDQSQVDEMLAKLNEYQTLLKESSHECHNALEDVALRALSNINQNKVVWIVLDRVEKCCSHVEHQSPSQRRSRKGALDLLRSLNRAVLQGAAVIKVLAVVNRVDWRVDDPQDDIWDIQNIVVKRFCQVD
ncbi:hypothetical protein FPOA_00098 [Fusarium poae]|uniref:Nephrocystin 3-like N-terminal domain-containing protein n=1 Tax=Fusarium poae TaxID=36050 RepID=A0A1B8B082_FUSPO|nr:hypothetical protein FPOA_00098 [Fusarium poae]